MWARSGMALLFMLSSSLSAALLPRQIPVLVRPAEGWDALLDRRQRAERLVRLGLVPERHRRDIVRPAVGVAVLDRHANALLEDHGILDVPAVERHRLGPVRAAGGDDAVIRRRIFLRRAPGRVEIVLRAGAVQRRR